MTMSANPGSRDPRILALVATALAAVAGFAAVYVTLGPRDNALRGPAATSGTAGQASDGKLNVGQMTAFVFKKAPEALPAVSFVDGSGKTRTLADWKGRVVLLNLWATWCAPCRKEMPSLARLQKDLGSKDFEVVALAVDRAGVQAAAKFLASIDAAPLALYVDSTARTATELKVIGMPTTLLIDRQGREIGRLTGPAEWDAEEAKRLVRSAL
jgi:thiol-disulfide isomerase/thioredoxin